MSEPLEQIDECQAHIISGSDYKFDASTLSRLRITDRERQLLVVAIIGNQGSGKSTFLNQCFGTKLRVLQSARAQKTTHGATLCVTDHIYLLDFEGSDSSEGSALNENRLALFALYLSDIVLVNIDTADLGRRNPALKSMLTAVLSARMKLGKARCQKTFVIALLRNPNNINSEADIAELQAQALEFFEETWENLPEKEEGLGFSQVFSFDAIPVRYDRRELNRDDLETVRTNIREYNQDVQTNFNWISEQWETVWMNILKNDTLNTPDFQELAERERLKVLYKKFKPSVVKPWADKMNNKEEFDPDSAFTQMKGSCLAQLYQVHDWTGSGEFINTHVTEDLSVIAAQWRSQFEIEAGKKSGLVKGFVVAGTIAIGGTILASVILRRQQQQGRQ